MKEASWVDQFLLLSWAAHCSRPLFVYFTVGALLNKSFFLWWAEQPSHKAKTKKKIVQLNWDATNSGGKEVDALYDTVHNLDRVISAQNSRSSMLAPNQCTQCAVLFVNQTETQQKIDQEVTHGGWGKGLPPPERGWNEICIEITKFKRKKHLSAA